MTKTKLARVERMITDLAAGPDDYLKIVRKASRAIDAIEDIETYREIKGRLLHAYDVTGPAARKARRDNEIAEMDRRIHEAKPRPGTYEHELAMMRNRPSPT